MPARKPTGWFPRRGEVCWLVADKHRPAIVISSDSLNARALDVCVVLLTSHGHRQFETRVLVEAKESGLRNDSWAKCDQVNSVPKRHVAYPAAGRVSYDTLRKIEIEIRVALELLD